MPAGKIDLLLEKWIQQTPNVANQFLLFSVASENTPEAVFLVVCDPSMNEL